MFVALISDDTCLCPAGLMPPLRLPLKSRFVALECFAGWGRVCGFRNQVEGGLPGHRRFVGADADASIASLALAALDVLPGGSVMVFDTEMRYVLVRGRALFDRGFSSVFLEGRLVADALSTERWAFYEPLYRSALLGETHSVEIASPDGEGWYAVEVRPLRAGDGEIVGGVSFAVGITERKRVEQQLLALVDVAPDASVLADGEGRIVRANARTELLFGYTLDELIGQQVEMLIPEPFRNAHVGKRQRYFVDPQVRPVGVWLEVTARHKDGSEFPIEVSLSPLETADGKLIVSAIRDLTERRRAEAELARLASIVAAAHDAIFSLDMDGRVTSWNEAAEALLGYSAEEILGSDVSCMIPENEREERRAPRDRALAGEAVGRADTQRMHKDGSLVDVAITAFPLLDAAGQQTGAAAIMRDIRASVRQTRELAASEQRYREILEHTPDGVMRLDVESRVDYVNERMAEILGYSPEEILGWHIGELIDPEERQTSEQNIEHDRIRMAGRVVERRLQCKDRRPCWARISTTALSDSEGNYRGALAIISDVTEARSRESELRSSERFVAAIADSMAEGMLAIDRDGCLTYMNHAAEQMLGWTQEELRGRSMHEAIHSIRKDGSAYPVEECPLMKVGETGVPVRVGDDVFVRRGGELLPSPIAPRRLNPTALRVPSWCSTTSLQ
jgi:PAS domain S-box-containing protein